MPIILQPLGCKNNMLKMTGVDNDSHRATIYIYELYISGWNLNLDHIYIIYVIHNIIIRYSHIDIILQELA